MADLSRATIQSLALLRAVSAWGSGAYGPVRIHKTLFFADRANDKEWTLFTYKRWYLGQYSDGISATLNELRRAGRIRSRYDGPSERITARLTSSEKTWIRHFFSEYFPEWTAGFERAFQQWAYLNNDTLIRKAHDDPSYTNSQHGQVILKCKLPAFVQFSELEEDEAEQLADMVSGRLQAELSKRLNRAVGNPVAAEDWRSLYFGDE